MQKQVITMIFFISTFLFVFIALIQCHFSVNFASNQIELVTTLVMVNWIKGQSYSHNIIFVKKQPSFHKIIIQGCASSSKTRSQYREGRLMLSLQFWYFHWKLRNWNHLCDIVLSCYELHEALHLYLDHMLTI